MTSIEREGMYSIPVLHPSNSVRQSIEHVDVDVENNLLRRIM